MDCRNPQRIIQDGHSVEHGGVIPHPLISLLGFDLVPTDGQTTSDIPISNNRLLG